jgi:hypothetical protein
MHVDRARTLEDQVFVTRDHALQLELELQEVRSAFQLSQSRLGLAVAEATGTWSPPASTGKPTGSLASGSSIGPRMAHSSAHSAHEPEPLYHTSMHYAQRMHSSAAAPFVAGPPRPSHSLLPPVEAAPSLTPVLHAVRWAEPSDGTPLHPMTPLHPSPTQATAHLETGQSKPPVQHGSDSATARPHAGAAAYHALRSTATILAGIDPVAADRMSEAEAAYRALRGGITTTGSTLGA